MQRGILRVQDAFPETCLAVAQVEYNPSRRGQQGTIPTCNAPGCRRFRLHPVNTSSVQDGGATSTATE
eukprot:5066980-Amphidinium_carterae.1